VAASQYHLRERVDQTLTEPIERWIHPLTQVVLTSARSRSAAYYCYTDDEILRCSYVSHDFSAR
jgi:hypothetical protein